MDLDLSGRVAVVTGAPKGIGLAVVRAFLGEGMRLVASSRNRTPELDALDGVRERPSAGAVQPRLLGREGFDDRAHEGAL